ncbi:MAG: hypothetical protein ACK5NC_10830 [Vibrio sp.]
MKCVNPQLITIENTKIRASVKLIGAELVEWTSKATGINHLWTENGWPNSAPILFPIIGNLANETYTYEGKTYTLSRHGFTRNSEFDVLEQHSDKVVLILKDNPNTYMVYPFSFQLKVSIEVKDDVLAIRYEVENTGCKDMLFSIGSHPAFTHTNDATLIFESLSLPYEGDNGFIDFSKQAKINFHQNKIKIDNYDFKRGPLYFKDMDSQTIRLENQNTMISMTIPNVPFLGLWKKPECDFICIEPWYGITAKNAENIEDLRDKAGMITLPSNERFSTEYQLQASSF